MESSQVKNQTYYYNLNSMNTFIDKTFSQAHHFKSFSRILNLLLDKHPRLVKKDLFGELERFLILSSEEFRKRRSIKGLLRIVLSHYFLRKKMLREIRISPEKRHLFTRLLSSQLSFPFGKKDVLGLSIVVHLPDRYDFFDEHHIILSQWRNTVSDGIIPETAD